jgi:hypothetical protein
VSQFDDPNREAVGLDPIWTDEAPPPEEEPTTSKRGGKSKAKDPDAE